MNKDELVIFSNQIKAEADNLLYNEGILSLLRAYGVVLITGSYSLNLMIKKDLDISLVNDNLTQSEFFEIGKILSARLNSHGMFYRNTKIKSVLNRPPDSFYWGIQTNDWMIDLWKVPKFYSDESVNYIKSIKDNLTEEKREIILSLKYQLLKNSDYGKKYSSKELYIAVVQHHVRTLDQFIEFVS